MELIPKNLRPRSQAMLVKDGDHEVVAVTIFLSKTAFSHLMELTKAEGLKKKGALAYLTKVVHQFISSDWKSLQEHLKR